MDVKPDLNREKAMIKSARIFVNEAIMSIGLKFTCSLFTIFLLSGCASSTSVEKIEKNNANTEVLLSDEQQKMLQQMRKEMITIDQLSESCRLVSEGNEKEALTKLQSIDWSNTGLKISKNGVYNEGIIDYFKKRLHSGDEECDIFSQDLIRDAY